MVGWLSLFLGWCRRWVVVRSDAESRNSISIGPRSHSCCISENQAVWHVMTSPYKYGGSRTPAFSSRSWVDAGSPPHKIQPQRTFTVNNNERTTDTSKQASMKQFDVDQQPTIESRDIEKTAAAMKEHSQRQEPSTQDLDESVPDEALPCRTQGQARLAARKDVCAPGFGSWCDSSSEEGDDTKDDHSVGRNTGAEESDHIVVKLSDLHDAYYGSRLPNVCRDDSVDNYDNADEALVVDEDEVDRFLRKRMCDEELLLSNLKRRNIRFSEEPQVEEFEPAPLSCHPDLYYSGHQLQRMMDTYYEEGQDCSEAVQN
jgi:hypothetical protein